MRKRSKRLCSLLMALVMALSLLPTAVFAAEPAEQTYVKVTEAPEDWSGTYLIVYETGKLILNGSLDTLDAKNNTVDVTIADAKIIGDYAKYAFTVEKMENGYAIQSASGKYISGKAGSNVLNSGTTQAVNTISMDAGAVSIISDSTALQYNVSGARFRYNRNADQNPPALYKLEVSAPERESGIVSAADLRNGDTVVIFNPANGKALSTMYNGFYNNGTDVTLADGELSGYTATDIWTVGINEDGTYTFATSEGKKLAMQDKFSSMPLEDKAATHTDWSVTAVTGKTDTYYIDNVYRAAEAGPRTTACSGIPEQTT